MAGGVRHSEIVAHLPPAGTEVVRVAPVPADDGKAIVCCPR